MARTAYLESVIVQRLPSYLEAMEHLGVQPPLLVGLSLLETKGSLIRSSHHRMSRSEPIDQSRLVVPEVMFDSYTVGIASTLRPVFDALWNAGGYSGSPNYDQAGNYSGL